MHTHFEEISTRLFSPLLWRGFGAPTNLNPTGSSFQTPSGNPAFGFFDDFLTFQPTTLQGPYALLATTTAWTLIADTAASKGIASAVMNSNAGDENILKWGGTSTAPFQLGTKDLVFECRVAVTDITASKWSLFAGLAAPASIVTDQLLVDTTGIPYAANHVGFLKTYADAGLVDGAYKAGASAQQSGATKTKLDSLHTFAASGTTYVKLGFRYRAHPRSVEWYVNGVMPGGVMAPAKLTSSEVAASTFPGADADFMAPFIGIKDIAGDQACTLNIDWWACAQYE